MSAREVAYRVARAPLAARVTAPTVTALGPPSRSSFVAASRRRARDAPTADPRMAPSA